MNNIALVTIVERHLTGLFQRALLLTGHHDPAWDLVQDTWERAMRHLPESLPEDRVWSWLATVMRNRFMDQVRRSETRRNLRLSDEQWSLLPTPESDGGQDWQRFSEDDIRVGLHDLPETLRAPFTLHALEGMRYAEVASRLGVRLGTVGTRILRARRILRQRLLEGRAKKPTTKTAPAATHPRARTAPKRVSRTAGTRAEPQARNLRAAA